MGVEGGDPSLRVWSSVRTVAPASVSRTTAGVIWNGCTIFIYSSWSSRTVHHVCFVTPTVVRGSGRADRL